MSFLACAWWLHCSDVQQPSQSTETVNGSVLTNTCESSDVAWFVYGFCIFLNSASWKSVAILKVTFGGKGGFSMKHSEIWGFFRLDLQVWTSKWRLYSVHSAACGLWNYLYVAGAHLSQQDVTSLSWGRVAMARVAPVWGGSPEFGEKLGLCRFSSITFEV